MKIIEIVINQITVNIDPRGGGGILELSVDQKFRLFRKFSSGGVTEASNADIRLQESQRHFLKTSKIKKSKYFCLNL